MFLTSLFLFKLFFSPLVSIQLHTFANNSTYDGCEECRPEPIDDKADVEDTVGKPGSQTKHRRVHHQREYT